MGIVVGALGLVVGCGGGGYPEAGEPREPESRVGERVVGVPGVAGGLVKVEGREPGELGVGLPGEVRKVVTGYYRLPSVEGDAPVSEFSAVVAVETERGVSDDVVAEPGPSLEVRDVLVERISGGYGQDELVGVSELASGPLGGVSVCGYAPEEAETIICAWRDVNTAGAVSFPNTGSTGAESRLENRVFGRICATFLAVRHDLER
ncbi:hypothetical protein [Actinocorallia sp. A-T 12471]|uniref:hypothetical protein n=1 Tax=Actinocorallia sp. A-T 12471 TaxID=3089813 RepID=UPI0029CFB29C|nr:hypothetical protein [Actinocorallia sp. A-T 12471]MDX6743325.1 hypothetical protein [Actinocorallia sp. A-T 12471]